MNYLACNHIPSIEECLRNWGEISSHPTEVQWEIVSPNARCLPVQASLADDWLRLQADTGVPAGNGRISSVLKWNGELDGAAKFFLQMQSQSIGVSGEIPLDAESDIVTNLAATLEGFGQAALLIRDSSSQDSDPRSESAPKAP